MSGLLLYRIEVYLLEVGPGVEGVGEPLRIGRPGVVKEFDGAVEYLPGYFGNPAGVNLKDVDGPRIVGETDPGTVWRPDRVLVVPRSRY